MRGHMECPHILPLISDRIVGTIIGRPFGVCTLWMKRIKNKFILHQPHYISHYSFLIAHYYIQRVYYG